MGCQRSICCWYVRDLRADGRIGDKRQDREGEKPDDGLSPAGDVRQPADTARCRQEEEWENRSSVVVQIGPAGDQPGRGGEDGKGPEKASAQACRPQQWKE